MRAYTEANAPWLSEAVSDWRVLAIVGANHVLTFNGNWSAEQRKTFIALAEKACTALATRDSIPAEEIANWHFLDNHRIDPRGAKEVFTAPVVELGRAITALLCGELPKAPKGRAWYFGTQAGRSTVQMNTSWDRRR
jgi:hypothetical protein